MTISVDLGHVHANPAVHPPRHPRNGPARVHRRERRDEARRLAAAEATPVAEEAEVIDQQEKLSLENGEATENVEKTDKVDTVATEKVVTGIVSDVLCSEKEFNAEPTDTDIYEFESGRLRMSLSTWVKLLN